MNKKLVASLTLASFTQVACYNSYFIDKTELEKLESTVEPQEVVTIYGDCPSGSVASVFEMGPVYAQADEAAPAEEEPGATDDDVMSEIEEVTGGNETKSDATSTEAETKKGEKKSKKGAPLPANRAGCTQVDVSTSNALKVVTTTGNQRVTPFNFIMSGGQLVSPEYDVLVRLDDVQGAKVQEFSTWKTIGTIVGVSAIAIGTFVGISILAPDSGGFQP